MKRSSGVLLHPTSLPGKFGIGTLGKSAMDFVDYLERCGFTLWQTLPLTPTSFGDSPYASTSAFAGNPLLIDLEDLYGTYHFDPKWLELPPKVKAQGAVDFGALTAWKPALLKKIARFFLDTGNDKSGFVQFKKDNEFWLEEFAMFTTMKEFFDAKAREEKVYDKESTWNYFWPEPLKKRDAAALAEWKAAHAAEIEEVLAVQYFFDKQWSVVKSYANQKGISIIGDMPIFVAEDSVAVWARQELFMLDEDCRPTAVAGVPPDYFSRTGQLWGNPLYRWEEHERTDFAWWKERFRRALRVYDTVRIDHFRGFESYWQVPAGAETAEKGEWVKAPGKKLFDSLKAEFGARFDGAIIAEDLGEITPEVEALRDEFGFPGMKILQFAFSASEAESKGMSNPFLPHNFGSNCVCYTGTHDNDTLCGLFDSLSRTEEGQKTLTLAASYLFGQKMDWDEARQLVEDTSLAANFIATAISSAANTCVIPMQDILGLGAEARMNTPSTSGANWTWRMEKLPPEGEVFYPEELREMNFLYGRTA